VAGNKKQKREGIYMFLHPTNTSGCTWSLRLREEHGLNVFENLVLREIFGLRGEEEKSKDGENYRMSNSMFCATHQVLSA
jgi:hypothetical protein